MTDNTKLTIKLEIDFSVIKALSLFNNDMKEALKDINSFEGVTEEHINEAIDILNAEGSIEQLKAFIGITVLGLAHNR